MIDMSRFHYVVFDCDGVILDSNNLKTRAFAEAINGEPKEKMLHIVSYLNNI